MSDKPMNEMDAKRVRDAFRGLVEPVEQSNYPATPTDDMLEAARKRDLEAWDQQMTREHYADLFRAMVAAVK